MLMLMACFFAVDRFLPARFCLPALLWTQARALLFLPTVLPFPLPVPLVGKGVPAAGRGDRFIIIAYARFDADIF